MSVPYHMLASLELPYNHMKFIKCEVRDIRGAMEFIRRGVEKHASLFPQDKLNARYLNRYARRISSLEEDLDSWTSWAPRMPEALARYEVNVLRDKVFKIMMEMGPAAEAFHWSISPAWRRPKVVTPWRQISLKKFRKLKKNSKAAHQLLRHQQKDISALQESRDLAQDMERAAKNAAFQAREETSRARVCTRKARRLALEAKAKTAAAKAELQTLQIEILCLRFKNLSL